MFIGENGTTLPSLRLALSNHYPGKSTNTPVYVTADKATSHGTILAVLDLVRRAGIQRVSFAVTPESSK